MCAGAHREGPELRIFRSTKAARAFLQSLGLRRSVTLYEEASRGPTSDQSCCDNSDCRPAPYRTTSSGVEMLVGETWVWVPRAMVEHRSLEGDTGETNGGHWCGERYEGGFVTYCAFLPPTLAAVP